MKFRNIKIGELETYLNSKEYQNTNIIPITKQRVASHIHNPRAEKDDIALVLAEEENGNVLAFIGLMSDFIFQPEKKKVFWISCWWAHSEKGKSLGVPLLLAAYQASNGLLLADSSPDTISVFKKSRMFHVPEAKSGIKLFFKPLLKDVLLRKKPHLARFSSLLKWIDTIVSLLFFPFSIIQKLAFSIPQNTDLEKVDANNLNNISTNHENHFQRKSKEFDWILNFPWVLQKENYLEKRFYPFSTVARKFKNHAYVLKENGIEIASFLMTERDSVFKLHYLFFAENCLIKARDAILYLLIKEGAKEFTTFHTELTALLSSKKISFVYQRPTSYQYVCGKGFEESLSLDGFQYGDGDAVFT